MDDQGQRRIVAIGALGSGFRFVGPFDTEADALRWQANNAPGQQYEILTCAAPDVEAGR